MSVGPSLLALLETDAGRKEARGGAALAWDVAALAGRVVELSGHGAAAPLSAAMMLVRHAQEVGEVAAWVAARASCFFPPDAVACGIDVAALPVVRCPHAPSMLRASEMLVRSGAFALVVVDVGARAEVPLALQGRLAGLAQKHDAVILFLTDKHDDDASLGSMVSLRLACAREPAGDGSVGCALRVLKDKRHGPGATHRLNFARGLGM